MDRRSFLRGLLASVAVAPKVASTPLFEIVGWQEFEDELCAFGSAAAKISDTEWCGLPAIQWRNVPIRMLHNDILDDLVYREVS